MSDEATSIAEQNAVVAELRRALGYSVPHSAPLPVTPALALALAEVAAMSDAYRRLDFGVLGEILAERQRQIAKGYDAAHDDDHSTFEISTVAAAVALGASDHLSGDVPDWADYIIEKHGTRQRLVIAAALLVAEIERLDRASTPTPAPE